MTTTDYAANYLDEDELQAVSAPWGGRLTDLLVFIIPVSQFVELNIVGRLFAPDILLLTLFPIVLLSKSHVLKQRMPRRFLVLGLTWLLAQVMTDVVRATPFEDCARGWAMIVFTLTNFAVLYVLLFQNARRIVLYTLGGAVGGIVTYFLNPSVFATAEPWKFGYGFEVTVFLVLLATWAHVRSKNWGAAAILILVAALNVNNGARSLGGTCFLTAVFLMMQQVARIRRDQGLRVSFAGALVGFALLALAGSGFLRIYEYSAANGLLGESAAQKYEIQSAGRYGMLMGGRTEFFVGLEAALDSPIIGHGSWAKDWRYADRVESLRQDAGYGSTGGADSWLIPAHSHLVGAWVNAGILGAIFWMWVLSIPVRALSQLYATAQSLTPLIAFFALVLIWNVLLSPYGAEERFLTPYYVIVMMSALGNPADVTAAAHNPHGGVSEVLDRHYLV